MRPASTSLKHGIAILILAAVLTVSATAENETDRIYDRALRQAQHVEIISPDHKLTAVYWQTHPGIYGKNGSRLKIRKRDGTIIAETDLRDLGGRLIAIAHWSPDSRYFVFTTISAGGHSPWHFDPYAFSVTGLSFRLLDDGDGVIDPRFQIKSPATVIFKTRAGILSLILHQ